MLFGLLLQKGCIVLTMDKTAVPCNTNILASLSGVSTILFDLGGTLWSPFGTKTRDEVLESAIAGLIKDLKDTTGRDVSREDVEIGIVNLLFGLGRKNSGEYEPSLEDAALQEVDLQGVIGQFLSSERICLSEKKVSDLTDRFADSLSKYYLLYPETVTVLSTLKRRGYNIGIVSNTAMPSNVIDRYLAASGIINYMDFRVLSSEVGWRKPHKRIYKEALRVAHAEPREVVFIGDRVLEDTFGPSLMGMRPILVRRELYRDEGSCDEYHGLYVCSLEELI